MSKRKRKVLNSNAKPDIPIETSYSISNKKYNENNCNYKRGDHCIYADMACNPNSVRCRNVVKPHQVSYTSSVNGISDYISISTTKNRKSRKQSSSLNSLLPREASKLHIMNQINNIPDLYIYGGSILAAKQYLQDYVMLVKDLDNNQTRKILVTFDINNKRYYFSKVYLDYCNANKIRLKVHFHLASNKYCTNPLDTDRALNQYSVLSLYGYKTGKINGLPTKERQRIINFLINNHIANAYAIVSLLQYFISQHKNNDSYKRAIQDWTDDINYIHQKFQR